MAVNPTNVITEPVRLSYVNVFEPRATLNGDLKYSATLLISKNDTATKGRMDGAIAAATESGISTKWGGQRPPVLAIPIHDGDGVRPSDGAPFGEECRGCWVLSASSKEAPGLVDSALNRIMQRSEIYSGVYARVDINFYPYNASGKKGVGCGLNNVMKVADGEPLGGRQSATQAFGQYASAGQAPAQAPAQQYVPPTQAAYTPPVQQKYAQQVQPAYAPPVQTYAPPVQQQPQTQPQTQINPITGLPMTPPPGGVMGV